MHTLRRGAGGGLMVFLFSSAASTVGRSCFARWTIKPANVTVTPSVKPHAPPTAYFTRLFTRVLVCKSLWCGLVWYRIVSLVDTLNVWYIRWGFTFLLNATNVQPNLDPMAAAMFVSLGSRPERTAWGDLGRVHTCSGREPDSSDPEPVTWSGVR